MDRLRLIGLILLIPGIIGIAILSYSPALDWYKGDPFVLLVGIVGVIIFAAGIFLLTRPPGQKT